MPQKGVTVGVAVLINIEVLWCVLCILTLELIFAEISIKGASLESDRWMKANLHGQKLTRVRPDLFLSSLLGYFWSHSICFPQRGYLKGNCIDLPQIITAKESWAIL